MTVEQGFSMGNRQSVEAARQQRQVRTTTQIVMLGTGAPGPDPVRSGPATAIVVNGTPYLIDFGPGVVRRAAAAYQKGVVAFGAGVNNLQIAFLTHLHADHTAGYPDLILTPWIMGRKAPLEVYGPKGIKAMTKHVLKAWELDIANRVDGMERGASSGCRVNAHEIDAGPIYTDANIRVTAFPVNHGEMDNAFGFRFETADRTIVISGDTAPTAAIVENCNGCDVLIHEAYSQQTYGRVFTKMAGLSPEISYVIERVGRACKTGEPRIAGALSSRQPRRQHRSSKPGRRAVG
jgi:ribonuclease BN (tRNA processing enzyme)